MCPSQRASFEGLQGPIRRMKATHGTENYGFPDAGTPLKLRYLSMVIGWVLKNIQGSKHSETKGPLELFRQVKSLAPIDICEGSKH